jgi:PAS domain S-box-containing protein
MTLRFRTLGTIGLAFAGLVFVLAVWFRAMVMDDFVRQDASDASESAGRAAVVVQTAAESLGARSEELADSDDDLWRAMAGGEEASFARSMLQPATLAHLRVDFLLMVDNNGRIVYSLGPLDAGGASQGMPEAARRFAIDAALRHAGEPDGINVGVMPAEPPSLMAPLLLATRPIRPASGVGKPRGLLLLGQFINEARLKEWKRVSQLTVSMSGVDAADLPPDVRAAAATLAAKHWLTAHVRDEGLIDGYAVFRDLRGRGSLVLKVERSRAMREQGRRVADDLTYIVLITGLCFALVALWFLEHAVLSRLAGLSRGVARIEGTGDPSARVLAEGTDELGQLADAINGMLAAVERSEQERHEADLRYSSVVTQTTEGIGLADLDTKEVVEANPALLTLLGLTRDELEGRTWHDLADAEPSEVDAWFAALSAGEGERAELDLRGADGRLVPVEVNGNRIVYGGRELACVIVRDLTARRQEEEERRRFEAQLLHTQKLESLGVLAGGIAHDFNNLLTGVLGNVGLALMHLPVGSPARQSVERIETAADRAAELVNQLLAYAGKGSVAVEPVSMGHLVTEMADLLRLSISKLARLEFECAEELPAVLGDSAQLRQVVMNLITNASDAVGQGGGTIRVELSEVQLTGREPQPVGQIEPLPAGRYVALRVTDTGCGMDAATVARIFDPFFTTKFTGRGLGLAAVLGIVRSHGGALHVESRPAAGTTFKVLLPAADVLPEGLEVHRRFADLSSQSLRGRRLLVVDDETAVADLAAAVLRQVGAEVTVARDGIEGLACWQAAAEVLDLAILDLTMPGLGGLDLFAEIRRLDPHARIILCSGYPEPLLADGRPLEGLAGFLAKPYRAEQLVQAVCQALGASWRSE